LCFVSHPPLKFVSLSAPPPPHHYFLLTPCSRVIIEKQTVTQLVSKLPHYYGTLRFITVFTTARQRSPVYILYHIEEPFNIILPCTLGLPTFLFKSRDSSVGIALGYGMDDRGSRFRFPAGAGNFSLYHSIQNGSGVHPASYPMGTRGSFLGDKVAGV
jgi:hypothetical protein